MIKISHRGNLNGPNPPLENTPEYIDKAINQGFDVEIDLWVNGNKAYLGHDKPDTEIRFLWLSERLDKLWIHCKNLEALSALRGSIFSNYFYHCDDRYTLTSKGYIWTFPCTPYNEYCIVVSNTKDKIKNCLGVCSDYISLYE